MMDIVQGFFVLAYRNRLLYFYVDKIVKRGRGREVRIPSDAILTISVKSDQKVICLQGIGAGLSCIVTESLKTREVSFMSLKMVKDEPKPLESEFSQRSAMLSAKAAGELQLTDRDEPGLQRADKPTRLDDEVDDAEDDASKKKLMLIGLSIKDTSATDSSPLLKFESTASRDQSERSDGSKWYHVGLLLRENGRVEVYADFILVDEIVPERDNLTVVDLEAGDGAFFLKVLKPEQPVEVREGMPEAEVSKLEFEYYRVKKTWRNRIGVGTLTRDKKLKRIDQVLHRRVASYF